MSTSLSAQYFDALRCGLSQREDLRAELEAALALNLQRANPSDRGNRFIFGAGVEWIVAAVCQALGVPLVPGGHNRAAVDLVPRDGSFTGWSVKSSANLRVRNFRISNGLGGAGNGMTAPTLFLAPPLGGMVYVDPVEHPRVVAECIAMNDATVLPLAAVLNHRDRTPEVFAPVTVPANQGTQGSENHFESYARALIDNDTFPLLRQMFL